MSSRRDGSKPLLGVEASGAQSWEMAHFNPKLVQAKRRMAHPVRRGPRRRIGSAFAALTTGFAGTGPGGAATRLLRRFAPKSQRRRELLVVLALLVAAAAVSASLPGGWTDSASGGTSPDSRAGLVAQVTESMASSTPFAPETFADPPLVSPSDTPPPTPKPTPVPTKKPVAKTYTFVALGDSLTAWPSDAPWPTRLDAEDANLRMVNNAGVPGDLTSQMLARLNSDVLAYKPEVLFILGGTNDLGRNVSQATTIANLRSIIVAAKAKGIRIFLMTIPPNSSSGMAAEIDSLNAAITHLGNIYTLVVIDIHTPLSQANGTYVPKYTSDGLHFTALGAQTVANTIYNRIHRLGY